MPKPMDSKFFRTGQTISSFKEKDINGVKYNLKELQGKIVVLNFWFINCPPCRQEIPHLNDMVESYKDNKDVVFIAVALDEKYDLEQFLKTMPYNYNIIDKGRYIAQQYGINAYPTHVILDKQGKVIFHTSGFGMGTVSWLKKSIEAGLNETVAK
jgi:thiol-disulfide isomerase/thioredoxin